MPAKGYRAPRVTVHCAREGCGKPRDVRQSDFDRNTSGRFFCSNDCRKIAGSKPRTLPDLVCQMCGDSYHPPTTRAVESSRYCSRECKRVGETRPRVSVDCPTCGTAFDTYETAEGSLHRTFCSHKCATDRQVTRSVGRLVNGRAVTMHVSGYLMVWVPGRGRMMEHRYVMEQALGRELGPDEHVHHMNNIKMDNRLENLALLSPSTHALETRREVGRRAQVKAARIRELEAELVLLRQQLNQDVE
jgi:endogenous inhibitor of DNA gyrase (YacG/DUF329 family)